MAAVQQPAERARPALNERGWDDAQSARLVAAQEFMPAGWGRGRF